MDYLFQSLADNGKSVAVVSGLLAKKREAITIKSTNTKSTTDNIQSRITATQCYVPFFLTNYYGKI